MHKNNPSYLLVDLNASSTQLGNNYNNQVGKHLNRFLNNSTIIHLGPNFHTYIARNIRSTPDLVLSNNKAAHNITLRPDPATLSDHLPIIMTLTTKAIYKHIPPRLNFKNVNWDDFKDEIEEKMNNINTTDNMNRQEIDDKLTKWYEAIESTIDNKIPTTNKIIEHKPISSPHLRYIQHKLKQLQLQTNITGWSIDTYNYYKTLK